MKRVRYTGPGDEFFPSLAWAPKKGEERDVPDDKADHPRLKVIDEKPSQAAKKEA